MRITNSVDFTIGVYSYFPNLHFTTSTAGPVPANNVFLQQLSKSADFAAAHQTFVVIRVGTLFELS